MATTNGTKAHPNGSSNSPTVAPIPATKILAQFVATAKPSQLTPEIRVKIKEVLVDFLAVAIGGQHNADSTQPIYNGILALQGKGTVGKCTVIGKGPPHMLPQYAGLLNSAFAHSLDFDDTYAEGTLHAGVTAISAAMTQAEVLGEGASIEDFMLAVSVGYEVTCRLGRELGTESYYRGFHNTGTAGVFGAVAAVAVLRRLSVEVVEMAFGLAGSKAAGSMQYLDNGSWNKRLHPGFAVHDAFLCVNLAEAGVVGATKAIEGKYGFLQAYTTKTDQDLLRLIDGLGNTWVWLESSLKPYPACRMTHTAIELAGHIHDARPVRSADVAAIKLKIPPACILLVGDPTLNKIHPTNHIDAQFSIYFQTANALLYGSTSGMLAYQKLQDPEIMSVCSKTTVLGDPTIPGFSADMCIEWSDGRVDEVRQHYPLGEVQHPFTRDKVDEKFLSMVVPAFGQERARLLLQFVDNLERGSIEKLQSLLW